MRSLIRMSYFDNKMKMKDKNENKKKNEQNYNEKK